MERRDEAVADVLRAVALGGTACLRDAWREVVRLGPDAAPALRAALHSPAWTKPARGAAGRQLAALLALLREVDRDGFEAELVRLADLPLHPHHSATVALMRRTRPTVEVGRVGPEVPVFVADGLPARHILRALRRWSRPVHEDMRPLTRIDVIPRDPALDYLGRADIATSGVILVWPGLLPPPFRALDLSFTFWHEVGHHACGHLEGGQVREQEEEADAYAGRAMRQHRPLLWRMLKVILAPLQPAIRAVLRRHEGSLRRG